MIKIKLRFEGNKRKSQAKDRHFLKGVGQFPNNKFLDSKTAEKQSCKGSHGTKITQMLSTIIQFFDVK